MRISELARRADVPVATVKFYLREGLLPPGELTSVTQAHYGEPHLARLRLVRALLGPGGLSVAAARDVLAAIEHPPSSVHDLLGVAVAATRPPARPEADHARVHALLHSWGWVVESKDCPSHEGLAEALRALDEAGFELPDGALEHYRDAMAAVGDFEVARVPVDSPAAAVRYVVLGTVLIEPLLLALRRLAQQQASSRRFGEAAALGD